MNDRYTKLPAISTIVDPLISPPTSVFLTVLNSKILTASFTTPSPKRIALSLGYLSGLTKVRAATVSVDAKTQAMSMQSATESMSLSIKMFVWLKLQPSAEIVVKLMKVPRTP